MVSLLNAMLHDDVKRLLDRPELAGDYERFFDKEKAAQIIHMALWAYSSRPDGTAGVYAFMGLMDALGIKCWTFDPAEAEEFMAIQNARLAKRP